MYASGLSTFKIAAEYGVSAMTIGNALKRRGVTMRKRADYYDLPDGTRRCTYCHRYVPLENFYKDSGRASGYGYGCKGCLVKKSQTVSKIYDITKEEYLEQLDKQKNLCEICGRKNTRGRFLCVDHCHKTNRVRGLLCHSCNALLGLGGEKPDVLRKAALYLEKHNAVAITVQ